MQALTGLQQESNNGVIALAPKIIKQEVSPFPFLRNVILWLLDIADKPMMQPISTK